MPAARLHADELCVDVAAARELVAAQFPQFADLPLVPMPSTGTDNVIFRLGADLGLRFPRIGWAVNQIEHEAKWLPWLRPLLAVELPVPLGCGAPADDYPWPWLVYRWVAGDTALDAVAATAADVVEFLRALQALDPSGAPVKNPTDRGGALVARDRGLRKALADLGDDIDYETARAVWEAALTARPWSRDPVWLHGDLLPGNLVLRDGRLAGVIDWAASGAGDPAVDLMIAWSLPTPAREELRASLGVDDDTWARGKGWTLLQAAQFIPYYRETIPDAVAAAWRRLRAVLED